MSNVWTWNDVRNAIDAMDSASRNDPAMLIVDPTHMDEDCENRYFIGAIMPYWNSEGNYGHEMLSCDPTTGKRAQSTTEAQQAHDKHPVLRAESHKELRYGKTSNQQ